MNEHMPWSDRVRLSIGQEGEQRASPENPSFSLSEIGDMMGWGGGSTRAGVAVNEETALTFSAVFCAIRIIAEAIAMLPFRVVREDDGGRTPQRSHPAHRLLSTRPNPYMTAPVFVETLVAHAVSWGNGFARIVWDNAGRPAQLLPIPPSDLRPERVNGRLLYRSTRGLGAFEAADILHVPGLGFDGLKGYSVIGLARESIGIGQAAEQFGAEFFGRGATMSGVLTLPGALALPERLAMGQQFDKSYAGNGAPSKTVVLSNGAVYNRLGIPPGDAQFLQTRSFAISDVARWFKVPPHMLGDMSKATLNNIEQQALHFLQFTLGPWMNKIEAEFTDKLLLPGSGLACDFDETQLRRADMSARMAYYASGRQWGYLNANEIRAQEGLNRIDGGDEYLRPVNMVPADEPVAPPAQAAPPTPEPEEGDDEPTDPPAEGSAKRSAMVERMTPVLAEIVARMNRKERNIRERQTGEKLAAQLAEHRGHVVVALAPALGVLSAIPAASAFAGHVRDGSTLDDDADLARLKGLLQ